ncbi:hypothetical protein [Caulobacter sp. BE254]
MGRPLRHDAYPHRATSPVSRVRRKPRRPSPHPQSGGGGASLAAT